MLLKRLIFIFLAAVIIPPTMAFAVEDTPPSADDPKPADAPKLISYPKINVDILDYDWQSGLVWENFNKTECSWKVKVKNNNPEPRHICINYEFLDEDNLPVFQNGKCEVVLGQSEGIIVGSTLVKSHLVQDVKKSHVVALEAHRLHSFVPSPPTPAAAPK